MPEDTNLLQVIKRQELPVLLQRQREAPGGNDLCTYDSFVPTCRDSSHQHGCEILRSVYPFEQTPCIDLDQLGEWARVAFPKAQHLYGLACAVASWCVRHGVPLTEASMGTLTMRVDLVQRRIVTKYLLETQAGKQSWCMYNDSLTPNIAVIDPRAD